MGISRHWKMADFRPGYGRWLVTNKFCPCNWIDTFSYCVASLPHVMRFVVGDAGDEESWFEHGRLWSTPARCWSFGDWNIESECSQRPT